MKTLEPFLEAFKKTEAEEMQLEPGERLSMVMSGHKIPVGREPMQPDTLLQMASESLNPAELSSLSVKAHRIATTYSGRRFEVTFSRPNGSVHIVVRKSPPADDPPTEPKAAAAAPRPGAKATPSTPPRAVAAPIRERWQQGHLGVLGGPRCARGAMQEGANGESWALAAASRKLFEQFPANLAFRHYSNVEIGIWIAAWNDTPGRTAEEVASAMEAAALAAVRVS